MSLPKKSEPPRGRQPSEEEFVISAIEKLRTPPYKGIHSVYSGFNEAFRRHFKKDPIQATGRLAQEGKIVIKPVKGGVMLYLREPSGQSESKPSKPTRLVKKEGKIMERARASGYPLRHLSIRVPWTMRDGLALYVGHPN